jgi:carboxylesterase
VYAPALRLNIKTFDSILLHVLAPFVRWLPKKNLDSNTLWQGYTVNPLKGVLQLINLQKKVYPHLPEVTQPVLIIQGKLDTTVHPEVPNLIFDQVGSKIKEKYWMEKSQHCVILDQEFDQVTEITHLFLDKVLSTKTIKEPV